MKDLFGNDLSQQKIENKFFNGNGDDDKHYWLTPPDLFEELNSKFHFDFDPCPYPKPDDFDGLTVEWGQSNYVNPPFGSILHQGAGDKKPKKKGPTAWARKAIEEHNKGKTVVFVYPIDKWVLMLIEAGAKVTNLGDVKWCATEDGTPGNGTGRHIAQFTLGGNLWRTVDTDGYPQGLGFGETVKCEIILDSGEIYTGRFIKGNTGQESYFYRTSGYGHRIFKDVKKYRLID